MGVDTRCWGTASFFPEELGLDQSGLRALAVPSVKHPLPPGASCLSLKDRVGKGVTPAGWLCRGRAPGGLQSRDGAGPPGGYSHGMGQGPRGLQSWDGAGHLGGYSHGMGQGPRGAVACLSPGPL